MSLKKLAGHPMQIIVEMLGPQQSVGLLDLSQHYRYLFSTVMMRCRERFILRPIALDCWQYTHPAIVWGAIDLLIGAGKARYVVDRVAPALTSRPDQHRVWNSNAYCRALARWPETVGLVLGRYANTHRDTCWALYRAKRFRDLLQYIERNPRCRRGGVMLTMFCPSTVMRYISRCAPSYYGGDRAGRARSVCMKRIWDLPDYLRAAALYGWTLHGGVIPWRVWPATLVAIAGLLTECQTRWLINSLHAGGFINSDGIFMLAIDRRAFSRAVLALAGLGYNIKNDAVDRTSRGMCTWTWMPHPDRPGHRYVYLDLRPAV